MCLALLLTVAPQQRVSVVPPAARAPLPRPVVGAPLAVTNDNRRAAGTRSGNTLVVTLDVVEAAFQPEGPHDPAVRAFAFAESGHPPTIPGPMLRAPVGTVVRLTVRNRTDTALVLAGLRRDIPAERDTVQLAAGATRTVTFTLDRVGNYFYWAMVQGQDSFDDRFWLDSQLTGALVVDAVNARGPTAQERVWLLTEWFMESPKTGEFESALVFNGKAWPYNERLTFPQGDSVHFRVINATAIEHPLHLHGFYFRVSRHGGPRRDSVVPHHLQPLQNMRLVPIGGSLTLSFLPTTPGNWVFHCHFAGHVGDLASLHGAPMQGPAPAARTDADRPSNDSLPAHDRPGGHSMRGLVVGMHITPSAGYREPTASDRRVIDLLIQKREGALVGQQTAYGFLVRSGAAVPAPDSLTIPGPVLELKRGQPVRIVVHNNLAEESGVHWHGLEIESFPDGVADFSGIGDRIMRPIPPGASFAADFTPPRNGTFPYHSHLHEMRQIGSGMYGALIVTDTPRDTLHDHVIVAGGGGLPVFYKRTPTFLLVNGSRTPRPLRLTVGERHRLRIVSIHADEVLHFRFGTPTTVTQWLPIARDGADLPAALRAPVSALATMGPGETADFTYTPTRAGEMTLEVWTGNGQRVALPIVVERKR